MINNNNWKRILFMILILLISPELFIIILIIIGLINLIKLISKNIVKNDKEQEINNMVNRSYNNSTIKPISKIRINTLKEKLGLFDITIYNDLFDEEIISSGKKYYIERKLKNVIQKDNQCSCITSGSKSYKVSIKFDKKDINRIEATTCTCSNYSVKHINCKHIYALLLNVKCEENILKIITAITDYINKMTKMLDNTSNYIFDNQNKLNISENDKNYFSTLVNEYQNKFEIYSEKLSNNKFNEDELLKILQCLVEDSFRLQFEIEKLLNKASITYVSKENIDTNNEESDRITFSDIFVDFIIDAINSEPTKDNKYDEELEKEMELYGLEEWQKEEVRKGNYAPWNFEQDGELEEDDYYYEDGE
ncbi:MAG: SWIM zinc finger family protein [Firmicutes bacterium]|nr:SWIM zinc finger family protein [Bacillota bacterium]